MTIILTLTEYNSLCNKALQNSPRNISAPFELFYEVPNQLGKGYVRDIEVSSEKLFPSPVKAGNTDLR